MTFMRSFVFALLLASAAVLMAQSQPAGDGPAPPEVDLALRERATKFLQAHVSGKFRDAEQYVAKEAKDLFYSSQKPRYFKFSIQQITYSDGFKKAVVTARCEREIASKIGNTRMNLPEQSTWKMEDGLWCWYVDPHTIRTPMGDVSRTAPLSNEPVPTMPDFKPRAPGSQRPQPLMGTDKKEVHFPSTGGSAYVLVHNYMRAVATVKVEAPTIPGLEVKAERERVAFNYSLRVNFTYKPLPNAKPPKNVMVNIHTAPANVVLPVQVVFDAPPAEK